MIFARVSKRTCLSCFFVIVDVAALAQASPAAASPAKSPGGSSKPSSTRLYGRVDQFSGAIYGAGLTIESLTLPTPILAVRGGSPAYWAGFRVGDRVTAMEKQGDILQVRILRNGQIFAAGLRTAPPRSGEQSASGEMSGSGAQSGAHLPNGFYRPFALPRQAGTTPGNPLQVAAPQADRRAGQAGSLPAPGLDDKARFALKTSEWHTLGAYDIVLMVDRSGSMEDLVDDYNLSRWQWVQRLVDDFAREADYFAAKTFSLVIFNDKYTVERGVSPVKLPAIFRNYQPAGGTRLFEPLAAALNEHFQAGSHKPLLIAVLSDGEPEAYEEIGRLIAAATRQAHSVRELHITFLGVGENDVGSGVFRYFDDSLTGKGAVYDVVDTVNFSQLKRVGLATALTRSLARMLPGR